MDESDTFWVSNQGAVESKMSFQFAHLFPTFVIIVCICHVTHDPKSGSYNRQIAYYTGQYNDLEEEFDHHSCDNPFIFCVYATRRAF